MRRLWFKKEMREAILFGRKTATTRTKPLVIGDHYRAVSGSRFAAKPFAVVEITDRVEIDDLTYHCEMHFAEEGFNSGPEMGTYINQHLPKYLTTRPLYYHPFKVLPA